jgi:hypothetical protein
VEQRGRLLRESRSTVVDDGSDEHDRLHELGVEVCQLDCDQTTAATRLNWIAALRRLEQLDARHVVSGHKQPSGDDSAADIEATIRYLEDIEEADAQTSTAIDFYEWMLAKQPRRANVGSLWGAAKLLKGAPAPASDA